MVQKKNINSHKVCVVGAGHVGLPAAACFAKLGHRVICVDNDPEKIMVLEKGIVPFYEPELLPLVKDGLGSGNLTFSSSLDKAVQQSDVIFIAVGTPPLPNGSADLSAVENVARVIAANLTSYKLIVEKSTVPVQTGRRIKETIARYKKNSVDYDVASNPEFLREGTAVHDFFYPDRVVIGVESAEAERILKEIYRSVKAPVVVTDINTAELIKHASNSFLAAKISFINAVARVCDVAGADVTKVAEAMGMDRRIGPEFLQAGLGWGGFCLSSGEQIVLRDRNDNIRIMFVEDLFLRYKKGEKFHALSFDTGKKEVCFKPITLVSRRRYKGKMIKIKTAMNRQICITSDHPMLVYDKNKFVVVDAENIRKGEFLPLFTNIPSLNKDLAIDLFDTLKTADFAHYIKVRPLKGEIRAIAGEGFKLLRSAGRSSCQIYDFKRKNYLKMQDYLLLEERGFLDAFRRQDMLLFTALGSTTYIRGRFSLDSNFMKLLGYYISEGHITSEKGTRGVRDRIVFSFNQKEKEYIAEVRQTLDFLCLKHTVRNIDNDKVTRITTSSKIFAYLITEVLKCGRNSYDAAIPACVFSLSRPEKTALLSALYRGDGYVYFPSYTPSISYDYGTVSKDLKNSMVLLFQSMGIVPYCKVSRSVKSTLPAYAVRVSGHNQIKSLPFFKDRQTQQKINMRLEAYKKIIKPTGYTRINDDFCIVKIKEIKSDYISDYTYSLEVEDTQTFVTAQGIITHNCFPKDVEAFIYIAKKLGYNFSLLEAVRDINDDQRRYFAEKIKERLWVINGKKIALLGLAFKPNTDDMRFAPALGIIDLLLEEGASLTAYDPQAMAEAKKILNGKKIQFCSDPYQAAAGADCLCFMTEWKEFEGLDFKKIKDSMNHPLIADGRNMFNPKAMCDLGFEYVALGR